MNLQQGLSLLVIVVFALGIVGCGDDDDAGADGSGGAYVEICVQHSLKCTNADDEAIATSACEQSWQYLEDQATNNLQSCEAAYVEVYECRIAELCPADEHEDDDDDPCMQEHTNAGLSCFG